MGISFKAVILPVICLPTGCSWTGKKDAPAITEEEIKPQLVSLERKWLEAAIVNLYGNTAVVTLVTHSYKKDKGMPTEKRMRFYDVWINRNGDWKVVSSQGTLITQ